MTDIKQEIREALTIHEKDSFFNFLTKNRMPLKDQMSDRDIEALIPVYQKYKAIYTPIVNDGNLGI